MLIESNHKQYLELRVKHLAGLNAARYANEYTKVNSLFEQALILLNKMPRIWEMYLQFLLQQPLVTNTRHIFDQALRALPVTQHARIWALYRPFANSASGPTSVSIWRRYARVYPNDIEDYIELLIEMRRYTEAVKVSMDLLNRPKFQSKNGKGHFQLWTDMIDLIVNHAKSIDCSDIENIFLTGIETFADQRGRLWTSLATYWINRGKFEKARDALEAGLTSAMTVRDFTLIFDSYVEFEESIIGSLMDQAAQRAEVGQVDEDADFDLDIRMLRFEQLMNRRPFLLNDVLLRQNPNNVVEWEKRVGLWGDNKEEVVKTYTDAIETIQPKKAVGKFHELWENYAKFYETAGDNRTARIILEKAVKVPYKSVSELAELWCSWAELELRNDNFDKAVEVMAKATQAPKRSTVDYFDETISPQQRVHKSWKLWSFYVDLVESVGDLQETRQVYERILELRIATPQTIVNYANLLEENRYFEESFKVR
jgi:pre-mRNA-splicing factor SYF1